MTNSSPQIGKREQDILTAIVETYISTGEPVGSRTLARLNREGLSAATIRNVMADLAEAGLLEQPHTSAGRVPSVQAYRYYVDTLSGAATLSPDDQLALQKFYLGVNDVEEFLERTTHVLSLVSRGVGIAVAHAVGGSKELEHVHFQRLADHKVLALVVVRNGVVRDRVLRVGRDLAQSELDVASRYINENFRGWTLEAVQSELQRRIEQERSEYDTLMSSIEQLCSNGALVTDPDRSRLFVEGTANLISTEKDSERLRQLLQALDEKQRVIELLGAYLDTKQEAVRVVIGLEKEMPDLSNFVLIGVPARSGNEVRGRLAVIGPTRMDYQHTITAVSYIAGLFSKLLDETE